MDRVEEIETAIDALPPEDFQRLVQWLRSREQRRWDEQMDHDAAAGKLDGLFEEAETESKQGLLREWPFGAACGASLPDRHHPERPSGVRRT